MASLRGVKFAFSEGDKVLCFEPDPTKAKVLYEAKIVEINLGRDRNGKRVPEYLVHFYGWNSSWDRIVAEEDIHIYDDKNCALMRKLADVVKSVKKNKTRKKKIDEILRKVLTNHEEEEEDEDSTSDSRETEEESGESRDSDEDSEDLETLEESDEEEEYEPKEVIIEVPDVLKKDLEHDLTMVTSKNKCLRLPAEPNVITILEGFVKNYAVNVLVGTVEKRSSYSPEHRIQLCKEVMDGLRIFFDFLLPTHLLYNEERIQYEKLISTYKYQSSVHQEPQLVDCDPEPAVSSPRRRKRHSSAVDPVEPAPKLARMNRKGSLELPPEEVTPRRITRHAAAEVESKKHSEKRESKSTRHHKMEAPASRATSPPPPLPIPNLTPVKNMSSNGRSTPVKTDQILAQNETEAIMNEMLSWRLVPEDVLIEATAQPSQIYGCYHLLRLFVKLPEFLSLMNIPDMKLRTLLRYFDNLLEYICDRRSEFMPNNSFSSFETAKHSGRR